MIKIENSKIIITYSKEAEDAFKILKKFTGKDNNRPFFKDITFQPNGKNGFSFYSTDSKTLAEYTPYDDVCLPSGKKDLPNLIKYKSNSFDRDMMFFSIYHSNYPPCRKVFKGFKKLYSVHIPDRKDFIKFLKNVIAESKKCKEEFFIKIFYCKDRKKLLVENYIYIEKRSENDCAVMEHSEALGAITYENISQAGQTEYFEEGNEINLKPEHLLKILSLLKNADADFYFMQQGGQLYFEEGKMRYLLMPFVGL